MTVTTFDNYYPESHPMHVMNVYKNQSNGEVKSIKRRIAKMNAEHKGYTERYTLRVTE